MPRQTDHPRTTPRRPAFTLVEMLTVLSIIVVVLGLMIPVWNTLVGNNALASGQNIVSATIATARADAVYNRQITGVLFFVDPKTGQTAMAEVQPDGPAYKPALISPAATTGLPTYDNGFVTPLEMLNYQQITLTTTSHTYAVSYVYSREVVLLPAGVGVALNNNSYGFTYTLGADTNQPFDRYLHLGAILFDANGALTSMPFAIPADRALPALPAPGANTYIYAPGAAINQLGARLGLITASDAIHKTGDLASLIPNPVNVAPPNGTVAQGYPLTSQVGLLLFDRNAYLNQHCGNDTANFGDNGAAFNELDYAYALPGQTPLTSPPASAAQPADKTDEETWLDQNGIAILISPFNGDLVKTK